MKHYVSLFTLLLALSFSAVAQHLSIDFPVEIPTARMDSWEQSIDLAGLPMQDFVAISIVFEGEGLDRNAVQCKLGTGYGWQDVPPFTEESVADRYVSELIFVPAEAAKNLVFQFQVDAQVDYASLKGRVHVFSPTGDTEANIQTTPSPETEQNMLCSCPQPAFIPRATWGGAFELNQNIYTPPAVYTTVTHLIVHHSAGSNTSNNWSGVVAAIFDYHVNSNGWSDIGYNWLIAPNGQLFEGRGGGDNVRGAHMCGYNNNTMGVCALGNYVNSPFPSSGIETLKKLLSWKSCQEAIAPIGNGPIISFTGNMQNISGHRDGCSPGATECPGNMLYGQLSALRQEVLGYTQGCQSVAVHQTEAPFSMILSPNPVLDQLQVQFTAEHPEFRLRVVAAYGRQVGDVLVEVGEERVFITTSSMKPGVYFVMTELGGGSGIGRFLKF